MGCNGTLILAVLCFAAISSPTGTLPALQGTWVLYNEEMKINGILSPPPTAPVLLPFCCPAKGLEPSCCAHSELLAIVFHGCPLTLPLEEGWAGGAGDGRELYVTWHFTGYLHKSNCVFCVRRAACAGQKSPEPIRTWAKCPYVILGLSEACANRPPAG